MPPRLTTARAAVIAAAVAAACYVPALGNRFALDDSPIVERNPAAQSVGAALRAFDEPYWPPEHGAGLWRPLVILSYAVDYQLSGGSTTVLHATNVVLHAAVTGLVVLAIAPFVALPGALAGGVLFAVHPVHVEAVANIVGRAELMVACFLLLAVLLARRVRARAAEGRASPALEGALIGWVVLGLLSKEHAVIAVPLLILDELAESPRRRLPRRDYLILIAITIAWLFVRRSAEGGAGFQAVAPTFFGLGPLGRVSTMMPAFLILVRLMVWPFDLSPDYHPQIVERLTGPTPAAVAGFVVLAALVAAAFMAWRRHRAIALGLLIAGLAWAPTSNLLFPSGIVLSERTLYLPTVGVVLVFAALADTLARRSAQATLLLVAVLATVWTIRTVTRIPDWRTTRDIVVSALIAHPESYKVHQSAARVFVRLGDRASAMREYRAAAGLFDRDPYLLTEAAVNARHLGFDTEAERLARASLARDAEYPITHQLLAALMLLRPDSVESALRHARLAVLTGPREGESARLLAAAFLRSGLPDSARAVWPAFEARGGRRFDAWLIRATTFAAIGMTDSARLAIDSAARLAPDDSISRARLQQARREVGR